MAQPLITRIPIKDRDGNLIDEKEVATYAGLLARAHEEGLRAIRTELLQVPTESNDQVAIVAATVETDKGTFTGIGDASPSNVNRRIATALIRMAETRAKARALRDAVNIGLVALEELAGDSEELVEPSPAHHPDASPNNVRPLPRSGARASEARARPTDPPPPNRGSVDRASRMTDAQRRLLFRVLAEHGYTGDEAVERLLASAGVDDLQKITKSRASQLIDAWRSNEAEDRAS